MNSSGLMSSPCCIVSHLVVGVGALDYVVQPHVVWNAGECPHQHASAALLLLHTSLFFI